LINNKNEHQYTKSTLSFSELEREEEDIYKRIFPFMPQGFTSGRK
jgi:hypothetical protein